MNRFSIAGLRQNLRAGPGVAHDNLDSISEGRAKRTPLANAILFHAPEGGRRMKHEEDEPISDGAAERTSLDDDILCSRDTRGERPG
jgi:hypothetical protein